MINLEEFLIDKKLDYKILNSGELKDKYLSSVELISQDSKIQQNNLVGHGIIIDAGIILEDNYKLAEPEAEVLLITDNENKYTEEIFEKIEKYKGCTAVFIKSGIDSYHLYQILIKKITEEATYMKELLEIHYIKLVHLLTQGADIGRIEEAAYEILNNPMIITDESYKVLAYSQTININDPIWLTIVSNEYCPTSIVEMTDYNHFWERLHRTKKPLFVDSNDFAPYIKRAVAEVKSGDNVKGYIALLEKNKTITMRDLQILQMVAELVGVKLTEKNAVSRAVGELEHQLLSELFSGTMNNETMAENRARSLGWVLNNYYIVFCIKGIEKECKYLGAKTDYIRGALNKYFTIYNYSNYGLQSYFMLGLDDKDKLHKILRNELESFMSKEGFSCCVGSPVEQLINVSQSYQQAKTAGELIKFLDGRLVKSVYIYSEISILEILMKLKDRFNIAVLMSNSLKLLSNLDKKEGTEYVETLKRFFENNQNVTDTAESMFLHRNTVNYRLKRIRKILDDDFDNPLVRLHIYISILIKDII